MSNVVDFGCNGLNPSKVGGVGSSVKYFPRPLSGYGNQGQGGPGNAFPATPSSTSAVGSLYLPAFGEFLGQQFNVIASGGFGTDSGDPSSTVTVQLYAVTGTLTSPTYTSIATTTAITPNYGTYEPWGIEASLIGYSVSPITTGGQGEGLLIGSYQSWKRGTVTAPTVITATITGLDFNLGNSGLQQGAVLGFVVGVTFAGSDATNAATMTQFTIES